MRKPRLTHLAVVLGIAGLLLGTALHAQQVGPPNFPQTLPSNTVVGRTQAGIGPASAIPFSTLGPLLSLSNLIAIGTTPVNGGSSGNCLLINGTVVGQTQCSTPLGGGIVVKTRSASTATVTVSAITDYFLCLDPTSNAITVNLPATPATGLTYLIKDCTGQSGTHNITITPAAGNIDGAPTSVMNANFQSEAVTYTGTQWSIN